MSERDPYTRQWDDLARHWLNRHFPRGGLLGTPDPPKDPFIRDPARGYVVGRDEDGQEWKLEGVEVFSIKMRFLSWEDEFLRTTHERAPWRARILYWLAERLGRERVRALAMKHDDRLARERAQRERQLPVTWRDTREVRSGSFTVTSMSGDWLVNMRRLFNRGHIDRAKAAYRRENERQPFTRAWWRAWWGVVKAEAKYGSLTELP